MVTGATGFIGLRVVRHLVAEGYHVRATVRATSNVQPLDELGVERVTCDLSQESLPAAATEQLAACFHLAGLTTTSRIDRLRDVNVTATERLAKTLASLDAPPTVVHVSSIAASGPSLRGAIRTPEDLPQPVSNYGRSKWEGEQRIARYADDFPLSIVRPSIVFGPGDREGFRIVKAIATSGLHVVPGWRTPPLSVIEVDDLATILVRVARAGTRLAATPAVDAKGVYVAARAEHPTYAEWGRQLAEAMPRRVRVVPCPPRAARLIGWLAERMGSGVLHVDKIREAQVDSWAYEDAKLADELGFEPSGSLEEQLRATIDWYRQAGWLADRRKAT